MKVSRFRNLDLEFRSEELLYFRFEVSGVGFQGVHGYEAFYSRPGNWMNGFGVQE